MAASSDLLTSVRQFNIHRHLQALLLFPVYRFDVKQDAVWM
jgi:hypothetical protein